MGQSINGNSIYNNLPNNNRNNLSGRNNTNYGNNVSNIIRGNYSNTVNNYNNQSNINNRNSNFQNYQNNRNNNVPNILNNRTYNVQNNNYPNNRNNYNNQNKINNNYNNVPNNQNNRNYNINNQNTNYPNNRNNYNNVSYNLNNLNSRNYNINNQNNNYSNNKNNYNNQNDINNNYNNVSYNSNSLINKNYNSNNQNNNYLSSRSNYNNQSNINNANNSYQNSQYNNYTNYQNNGNNYNNQSNKKKSLSISIGNLNFDSNIKKIILAIGVVIILIIGVVVIRNLMKSYTVTFYLNGASSIDEEEMKCKSNIKGECFLTLPVAKRYDGEVLGYAYHAYSTVSEFSVGEEIEIFDDTDLYVVSTKKSVLNIDTSDIDELSVSNSELSCTTYNLENKCSVTVPQFNKEGYQNIGYSETKGNNNVTIKPGDKYQTDKTLYPVYVHFDGGKTYDVKIDMNGREFARWWIEHQYLFTVLFPETLDTVIKLREKYKIGILTNGAHLAQWGKIEKSGLMPYVDAIVVSEDAGVRKPDAHIFEIMAQKLNLDCHECIYVGDTFSLDIVGAYNAGMKPVWIWPSERAKPSDFEVTRISKLSDLLEIL